MKPVPSRRLQLDELRRQIKAIEPALPEPALPEYAGPDASRPVLQAVPQRASQVASPTASRANALTIAPGLHEVCPGSYLDTPAALAFQIGLLAQRLSACDVRRPILWVRPASGRAQDFGRPYPLALKQWGLPPDHVLLVEPQDPADTLWALEEGLQAGAAVIGEIGRNTRYDLTASKRLHMTAKARTSFAVLLRDHTIIQPSAALTRWRISALQSPPRPWRGASGLPGLGEPRFDAVLERVRGGPPGHFKLEWKNAAFHVLEPAALAYTKTAAPVLAGQRRRTG